MLIIEDGARKIERTYEVSMVYTKKSYIRCVQCRSVTLADVVDAILHFTKSHKPESSDPSARTARQRKWNEETVRRRGASQAKKKKRGAFPSSLRSLMPESLTKNNKKHPPK